MNFADSAVAEVVKNYIPFDILLLCVLRIEGDLYFTSYTDHKEPEEEPEYMMTKISQYMYDRISQQNIPIRSVFESSENEVFMIQFLEDRYQFLKIVKNNMTYDDMKDYLALPGVTVPGE